MEINEMIPLCVREQSTLRAIDEIREKYPYAASMLIYVLIERQLKRYIGKNPKCFVSKLNLGDLEQLLGIEKRRYSEPRNDLMHSNLFLTEEHNKPTDERDAINKKKFDQAKKLLEEVFKKYPT